MLVLSTAVFAFVTSVVALGGLVLLTSRLAALARGWDYRHDQSYTRAAELEAKIQRTSTASLRAELDDLRAAVETVSATNRRELGKLWGKLGGGRPSIIDGDTGALDGDAELQLLLALQTAKPVQPNGA